MDVAGILLAAGSATRMGRNKLLLEGRGREVVRRHIDRASLVPFPASALSDVDMPGDLERARSAIDGGAS